MPFIITDKAVDLIKEFEGLRLDSYWDAHGGLWTIGYGTTSRAGVGVTVTPGMTITEAEAERYLRLALDKFAEQIKGGFTREPVGHQFGAMLSLAYNIGPGAFLKSTALRRFNEGDLIGCTEAMTWFSKAGGQVLRGLVRRRDAEVALFLSTAEPISHPDPAEQTAGPLARLIAAILKLFGGKA